MLSLEEQLGSPSKSEDPAPGQGKHRPSERVSEIDRREKPLRMAPGIPHGHQQSVTITIFPPGQGQDVEK